MTKKMEEFMKEEIEKKQLADQKKYMDPAEREEALLATAKTIKEMKAIKEEAKKAIDILEEQITLTQERYAKMKTADKRMKDIELKKKVVS